MQRRWCSGAFVLTMLGILLGTQACGNGSAATADTTASDVGEGGAETEDTGAASIWDECEPGVAPDAACYAAKRATDSEEVALAVAVADRFMDLYPAATLAWNWEESVLMHGVFELYRVTGEPRFRDYVRDWMDHHIAEGYDIFWSDTCVPALLAVALYDDLGDESYRAVVDEALHYLNDVAPRTDGGGISHLGTTFPMAPSLWVDSMFMFGMLLARWGELAGDVDALDLLSDQIGIFTDRLQDESGWYQHAYDPVGLFGEQDEGVFWARGNSWITVALHEYLRVRTLRGESDADVAAALDRQVAAVVASQDTETGLWWTVVSHPGEAYQETSGSALFAYGLARGYRYGLRDAVVLPVVARAVAGLRERIVEGGDGRPVVTGTSTGTGVGGLDNYLQVPVADDVPFGVGAALLLLVESSGLPDAS